MKKNAVKFLAGVMALTLVACGGNNAPASNEGEGEESAETEEEPEVYISDIAATDVKLADTNNLTEVTGYELQSMDYVTTAMAEDHEYNANFVDGLLENDQHGALKDCLATLEYDVNDDATEFVFHIKEGIKWVTNTGEEYADVTAHDFVTGLRHGAEFQSGTSWLLEGVIKGYADYLYGDDFSDESWEKVGIKAVDDYTLKFELESPTPYFPSMTTYAVLYPVNKEFLESKGNGCVLGTPDPTDCSFGAVAPDSILYNGGYILESNDVKSSTVLKKNEAYWDAENIFMNTVKRIYDDGSDPYSAIRGFEQGTYAASGLSAMWENFADYEKKYNGYITEALPNASVFGVVINFNRQTFEHTNYATDEAEREKTHNALMNDNFRKALRAAFDTKAYNMVSAPESLAQSMLRNMNNDPNVVKTSDGTPYGDLVTAAYKEATGDDRDLSDGQNPWLSKDEALAFIEAAKGEGVEFPVHLDMLVNETSARLTNQSLSMAKSVEENTDGQILVECVMVDNDTITNIAYRNQDPALMDYDISTYTGWSPDYADPKSFVDIYSPTSGYYMHSMGLTDAQSENAGEDDDIKEAIGLMEYEELYRAADKITDDMDARYKAFAKADAYLVERAFYLPTQMQSRAVRVSHVDPFTRVYATTGISDNKYKGLKLREEVVTAEEYNTKLAAWEKGE